MKQGWEYKKLGELLIFDKRFNGLPKDTQDKIVTFPHVSAEDLKLLEDKEGCVRLISTGNFNGFTTKEKASVFLSEGEIVTLPTGGSANIKYHNGFFVDSGNIIGVARSNNVLLKYVFYGMIAKNDLINYYYRGVSIKHPYMPEIYNIKIPVPPHSEQQTVVAELDKISELIDKGKEQLKELDNLAQAIFYDMFGDPITNEKGWEVKKMKDIVHPKCPISYGIVQPEEDVDNGIPIVRPIDFKNSVFVKRLGLKCTSPEISNSYKRTILRGDEILFCVRGTTGTMGIATNELKGCNVTRGIVPLFFGESAVRSFIYFALLQPSLQQLIQEKTNGIALRQINIREVRELPIPLPPLSLQQSFAEKIEAIEKQKALVTQSIQECQTLFDSRMNYYFGD